MVMLTQTIRELDIDIALVSEHPPNGNLRPSWHTSQDNAAAIVFDPPLSTPLLTGSGKGYCWAILGHHMITAAVLDRGTTRQSSFASCNAWSSKSTRMHNLGVRSSLWAISTPKRQHGSPPWATPVDFTVNNDLSLANKGNTSNFTYSSGGTSHIDVTLFKGWEVSKWLVRDDLHSHSDHHSITFSVDAPRVQLRLAATPIKWSRKKIDYAKFDQFASSISEPASDPSQLHSLLIEASDAAMPRHWPSNRRKPAYWWSELIAEARRACIRSCRALTSRRRDRTETSQDSANFRVNKKELVKLTRGAKENAWKELGEAVDNNP